MGLIHSLFAGLLERAWRRARDVAHDRTLAVGRWGVIWVLVVCDDGAWGLRFATGTGVVCGCFEEHLIDREGALRGAGGRSRVCVGIRVTWRGEGGLEREMWRWEMGAMVDIDVEGSSARVGLG